MRPSPDFSVYLVTDAALCARIGVEATVHAAVAGGASLVQLRDKTAPDAELVELARALLAAGAPLIVNDRVDVALASGADGVHVGQQDASPALVRARIGPDRILGLSIETEAQLTAMAPQIIDYIGVGPIRATSTKPDAAAPIGWDGFARIARAAPLPSVAIGGLRAGDGAQAVAAGAAGLAVVSAICSADDPEAAARALRAEITAARRSR
jgi:thiamine-phosphate pyrophosphorylase